MATFILGGPSRNNPHSKMSFLHRVAGLSLRDRVKSSGKTLMGGVG